MRLFLILVALAANVMAIIDTTEKFSADFYKTVAKGQSGNFISSPLSIHVALSMAFFGAKENTKKKMNDVLRMPDDEALAKSRCKRKIDSLNSVEGVEFKLANKIFINKDLEVKKEFQNLTKEIFQSEEQQLNFGDNQKSAETINSWCEANTNNRIKDLFKPDDLDANTAMVLVNAVYFKGQWKNKFDVTETFDNNFYVDDKTNKQVPTMFQREEMLYGQVPNQKARFVEIPYKSDNVSMVIVVPDEMNGLQKVEEKLGDLNLKSLRQSGSFEEIILYLPRFKIESSFDLTDSLTEMGMGEMFTNQANFRNIADADLKVSKAVQKAFIEVNEEGTKAAAATGLKTMLYMAPPPAAILEVNRPFLYFIVYDTDKNNHSSNERVVLFSGHVIDPLEEK